MSLYERDYARQGEQTRESSALSAFIKQTYQLFAASLLAGAAGAYVGVLYAVPIFAKLGMAAPFIILGVALVLFFAMRVSLHKSPLNLVLLFAFTTIVGWACYGLNSWTFFTELSPGAYLVIYFALLVFSSVCGARAAFALSDLFNVFMMLPNIAGLLILRKQALEIMREKG